MLTVDSARENFRKRLELASVGGASSGEESELEKVKVQLERAVSTVDTDLAEMISRVSHEHGGVLLGERSVFSLGRRSVIDGSDYELGIDIPGVACDTLVGILRSRGFDASVVSFDEPSFRQSKRYDVDYSELMELCECRYLQIKWDSAAGNDNAAPWGIQDVAARIDEARRLRVVLAKKFVDDEFYDVFMKHSSDHDIVLVLSDAIVAYSGIDQPKAIEKWGIGFSISYGDPAVISTLDMLYSRGLAARIEPFGCPMHVANKVYWTPRAIAVTWNSEYIRDWTETRNNSSLEHAWRCQYTGEHYNQKDAVCQ